MLRIDKDVPMPTSKTYPFDNMEVGDSFYYEGPRGRIASVSSRHAIRFNKKFCIRSEGNGHRCWRVK